MAFYYSRKIMLAITLAIFLAGISPRRVSGQNCNCPPDLCCSQWGYCGTGEAYCGPGCQEGPCNSLKPASKIVRHALKNPSNQNCNCPPDLCCSQWGYCGTGVEYCGPGCQEGPCNSLKPASKMVLDASFNRSNQNCNCPPNLCCSQWGYCGTGEAYCGPGCQEGPCNSLKPASKIVRNALKNPSNQNCNCPPDLCCSQWGYCGTGEAYCGPGCQEGPCNSLKPASKIVRHAMKNPSNQNCNCPPDLCCSQWGYCGTGVEYCGPGCQEGPCNSLKPASNAVRDAIFNGIAIQAAAII